jgi:hypothetical protein
MSDIDSYYGDSTNLDWEDEPQVTEIGLADLDAMDDEQLLSVRAQLPPDQQEWLDGYYIYREAQRIDANAPVELVATFIANAGGDVEQAEQDYRAYANGLATHLGQQQHSDAQDELDGFLGQLGIDRSEFQPYLDGANGDLTTAAELYSKHTGNKLTAMRQPFVCHEPIEQSIRDFQTDVQRPNALFENRYRAKSTGDAWNDAWEGLREDLGNENGARTLAEREVDQQRRQLRGISYAPEHVVPARGRAPVAPTGWNDLESAVGEFLAEQRTLREPTDGYTE